MSRRASVPGILAPALLAAACAAGPEYERPAVEAPAAFKEAQGWGIAHPADAQPRGEWWRAFGDPVLDGLAARVAISNLQLAAAEARYRQARAATTAANAVLFPAVTAGAGATRSRRAQGTSARAYDAGLDARWEVDLWGRLRRSLEAARAGEAASAADLESARLSLQAQLVAAYFQLRVADTQRALLEDSVKAFETSFRIARNRYDAGVAAKVDVVQAESQLRSVESQAIDLRATRAQLEHAIAVLVGQPPAGFSLPPARLEARLPSIPPGLPSRLLERRTDVAAAERRMAQANARVGAAEAAYFPTLSLTASDGFASGAASALFTAPARSWTLGAGLAASILDFGARGAAVDSARAAYDAAVAEYRQSVLAAFQEVEDNLAILRWLAEEDRVQKDAARLARESVVLTLNQYKAGTVGYLNVVLVQANQLAEERQSAQLLGRRLAATVGLVRALGGAWGD